jgi:lysophospholipase L1-like esterase
VISCPASVTVSGPGGSQSVTFQAPTTTGGALPVTVACIPASGAMFSVGATAVGCTATDSIGRRSQCAFSVTLSAPLLSVTKFVAFGDSVTEGENGRAAVLGMGIIEAPNTYPAGLSSLLNSEYPGQGITVSNQGRSGESAHDASRRLPGVLAAGHGGAVLLLDGYNNLLNGCHAPNAGTAQCRAAIDEVVSKVRECIQIAQAPAYAVPYVFVSTLTPPGPYVSGSDRRIAPDAIVQTNARLSVMVRAERAILVDPYPLFIGHESEYVEADGLHPRPAGYQALAEAFFAAIKASVPATPQFRPWR